MISTNGSDSEGETTFQTNKNTKFETIEFENFSTKISKEEIEKFLQSKNINYEEILFIEQKEHSKKHNIRLKIQSDELTLTKLEILKKEPFPGYEDQKILIRYYLFADGGLLINKHPEANEEIKYPYEYHNMIKTDFDRAQGSEGLIFKNREIIDKQRAVMGYLIKKMGSNLLSGKSIMNVSLPINIFDVRSLLEVFASQTCYAARYLEKAGTVSDVLESLKLTTTFAITTVHLAVAQLKPFNPILGETFQCKIEDSHFYIEQTSHHPPIFNFLIIGNNYKVYGYNQSEVSSGANSVKAKYKGSYTIELKNGITHKIFFPEFKLSGLLFGNRAIKYYGNLLVSDEQNDLISCIEMSPDNRGFLKKMFSKKSTNPDYFRGAVVNISKNAKFDFKEKSFNVDISKSILSSVEGEFTTHIKFNEKVYWDYEKCEHPSFRRMHFTLPSDSTFREDINWLRNSDENMAQRAKIKLEEIQRNDKKLRDKKKLK